MWRASIFQEPMSRGYESLIGNTPVPQRLTELILQLVICVVWQHVVTQIQIHMCRKPHSFDKLYIWS